MRFATILFLFLFVSRFCLGQSLIFSSEPANFIIDINKQFEKQLGPGVKTVLVDFTANYQNTFDEESRKYFVALFNALSKRGLKPIELYSLINAYQYFIKSGDFNQKFCQELSKSLVKTLEPQNPKRIIETIFNLEALFKNKVLYNSNFNKVSILNAKFEIGYFDKKQDYFNPDLVIATGKKDSEEEDIGWGEQNNVEEYDPWNDPNLDFSKKQNLEQVNLPSIEKLFFVFKDIDLVLVSPSDSIVILKTNGAYDLFNGVFVGKGGEIEWVLNGNNLNAKLDLFSLKVQNPRLLAEQVILTYQNKLKKPIKGVLEIKLEKRAKGIGSNYPKFKSYHNDAELLLNIDNYDYFGGLSLIGSKMYSASIFDPYAKIVANKGSRNTFIVQSRNFEITDTLITSDRVSFVTKFDKDSVSHPAVKMRFDLKNSILNLNKIDRGGYRNSMYSDTFHQVDIKSDAMAWDLKGGKMDFYIISGKAEVPAVFESFNYFNPDRIRNLSTNAGFNPLILAGNIVARKKVNLITIDEMVNLTKKERYQVSNGMLIGHQMGFFDFDPITNNYSLSRKGQHYFLSYMGKADFDDLVLSSLSPGGGKAGNASIDLNTKALDIKGTQDFKLSDSLGINFIPKDQSMQIVGNKVFRFNGEIVVKNYRFYGDFEVQYEQFLVKLKRIDSIRFIPLELFKKGSKIEIGGHMLYGKTGTLYLNSPDNKSGRRKLAEYPKLDIQDGVLVYFNEPGRNQVFEKDVYFKANSIKIDSLNSVNPVISGVFYTGNIFKPIQENLIVLPDTSVGIMHKAKSPYKLYGTESSLKAESEIVLSKKGIKTSGEISHLAGKFKAKEINLFEDNLNAKGEVGKITESTFTPGAYFPEVSISEYKLYWEPKLDSMSIASEKGFRFYAGSSVLSGALLINHKGLFGNGFLDRKDSDTKSESFKFNKSGFLAENSVVNIKSAEKDAKSIFSGKFVGVDFNVQTAIVKISSKNEGFDSIQKSLLEFPYSSYVTTIDNAVWNIKSKKITMAGLLENSEFKSTSPTQFGLKFNGTAATYDIAELNLNISGVESINSVDASIIPPKGLVAVKKDGMLESFTKAKIIADTLNKFHVLTNATVKINSKLSFSGNADYQFVNVSSDTFNIKLGNFEFAEIGPDGNLLNSKSSNKLSTIARAKVTEKDSIYLSPKILYKGDVTMLAPFKNLSLNGAVLPELKKYPILGGNWINYKGNKSEEISINVDETLKDGGKSLYVGMHFRAGAQNGALYPTFLSAKKNEDDLDIFLAKGVFKRVEANKKFVVSSTNVNEISNLYEFYDSKGIIAMEGKFNLLGAPSKIFETVGIANLALDSMKYQFSTMMKFDFPLSIPTTQKLGQNIVKSNLDAGNSDPAIVPDSPYFTSKLVQFIGNKDTEDYKNKNLKEHLPLPKFSTKFLNTLVFSDLDLKWNPVANAFHSVGKIGISNIGDIDINAMVDGYVEIVKSPQTGDELFVFLEISPSNWYYFGFKNGQLGMTSSDEEINRLISTPIGGKEKKSEVAFVDANEASKFRKRFLQVYKGVKETEFAIKSKATTVLPTQPKAKSATKKEEEKEGF